MAARTLAVRKGLARMSASAPTAMQRAAISGLVLADMAISLHRCPASIGCMRLMVSIPSIFSITRSMRMTSNPPGVAPSRSTASAPPPAVVTCMPARSRMRFRISRAASESSVTSARRPDRTVLLTGVSIKMPPRVLVRPCLHRVRSGPRHVLPLRHRRLRPTSGARLRRVRRQASARPAGQALPHWTPRIA